MSRHLWNSSNRASSEDPSQPESESQHLGIFAATVRAVKGLAGRPTPATDSADLDLPVPRPTLDVDELGPPSDEITVEFPRYYEIEPAEPALSMLSRGRHGLW
ncbi:MAG TPA: hypothetical protein VGJ13_19650 [Pseudonocardiaceae bacterium]|jgi:hypothetical protein